MTANQREMKCRLEAEALAYVLGEKEKLSTMAAAYKHKLDSQMRAREVELLKYTERVKQDLLTEWLLRESMLKKELERVKDKYVNLQQGQVCNELKESKHNEELPTQPEIEIMSYNNKLNFLQLKLDDNLQRTRMSEEKGRYYILTGGQY